MNAITPRLRFRQARERLGLSPEDVASRCGTSPGSVYDIEDFDGDMTACYSPKHIQRFCRVLNIRPAELFGVETTLTPVSAEELVQHIQEQCRSRGVTLEKFEDAVGWKLSACMSPPERLLEGMTVDGLQWLCRELGIDWHRVILGL